jgi:hypothetical protein
MGAPPLGRQSVQQPERAEELGSEVEWTRKRMALLLSLLAIEDLFMVRDDEHYYRSPVFVSVYQCEQSTHVCCIRSICSNFLV